MNFQAIAPYLQDPLVLIGFVLLLGFLFVRGLVRAGIFPQLNRGQGYRLLHRILLYGFVVALTLIAVGFGLKYNELSAAEKAAAVRMLDRELEGNVRTVQELSRNVRTILEVATGVAQVLRNPDIRIAATLFPSQNLVPGQASAAAEMAEQAFAQLQEAALLDDEEQRKRFDALGRAIRSTADRTMPTVRSLADADRSRYRVTDAVWSAQLSILRKVDIIDVTEFQSSYQDLAVIRANYDIVIARAVDYLTTLQEFFTPKSGPISRERLAAVLAAERLFVQISSEYGQELVSNIERLQALRSRVAQAS